MEDLNQRALTSSAYGISAQVVVLITSFARSVILARILVPEDFGEYVFAASAAIIVLLVPSSWLRGPYLHRSIFTEGEQGVSTHFTLSLALNTVWLVLTLAVSSFVLQPAQWSLFAVLLVAGYVHTLTRSHHLLLVKRVMFKRIAIVELVFTLGSTLTSLGLAYLGYGVWSLVSINIVSAVVNLIVHASLRPIWRWRLSLQAGAFRYYFDFGKKTFVAEMLEVLLSNIDNLWTGYFLGPVALGFYSRAYQFSDYSRKAMALPLNSVAAGTYAELKGDRKRLSRAFFQFNSLIVRVGFASAGLLVAIAPEFILLFLGQKWLPMLAAIRLLLVFSMLEPLKISVANVLVAVGKPGLVGQATAIQLIVLLTGLLAFTPLMGIIGVALAVDIMLIAGLSIMLFYVSGYVDFSLRKLFLGPFLGLLFGVGLTPWLPTFDNLIQAMAFKTVMFGLIYIVVLLLFDRSQLFALIGPVATTVKTRVSK